MSGSCPLRNVEGDLVERDGLDPAVAGGALADVAANRRVRILGVGVDADQLAVFPAPDSCDSCHVFLLTSRAASSAAVASDSASDRARGQCLPLCPFQT